MTSQLMEALGNFWESQAYSTEWTAGLTLPSIDDDELAPLEKKIGNLQMFIRELQIMLQQSPIKTDLDYKQWVKAERATVQEIKLNLQELLDKHDAIMDVKEKMFMAEFFKGLDKEDDTFFYLNQFFTVMDRLNHWDSALNDICQQLEKMQSLPIKIEDTQRLYGHLSAFEKELANFHSQFGKSVSTLLHYPLSETQQAIKIGQFRKCFQNINNTYGKLKGVLQNSQLDLHLSCMCHFSDFVGNWPLNNRVFDIHEGSTACQVKPRQQSQRSLLIFTCAGGYGHVTAAKAMVQSVEGQYHVLLASTLEETLAGTDPIKILRLNFSQEKLYNYLLRHEKFKWIKLLTSVGSFFFLLQQKKTERLIRNEVLKQNPDMLVSCIPIFNPMFINIAKELNLPLIVVTTDLHTGEFTKGMNSIWCDINYERYRVTLAYEDPVMREIIERRVPKDRIHISGFPVRNAFNQEIPEYVLETVQRKYRIKHDEKMMLIMMGGNAGIAVEKYAKILAKIEENDLDEKLHVLCLCGDAKISANLEMIDRIRALEPKSKKVRIDAVPATHEIAELMSLADVVITKPGGCSTNEALAKKVPIIFHAPFALMTWEKFNMQFCLRMKMGLRFKIKSLFSRSPAQLTAHKNRLVPLIKASLLRSQELKSGPHPIDSKDFNQEFVKLVDTLFN